MKPFRAARNAVLAAGCLVVLAGLDAPVGRAQEGDLRAGPSVEGYESLVYQPTGHDDAQAAPLVVALHGCKQKAADFAAGSGFNDLADQEGFVVLYPQTRRPFYRLWLNPYRCWEWWTRENQSRGGGEPAVILRLIETLEESVKIDARRVFVAGLSSGGAMSAILGSLHPEVFAAAGVHSGLAFAAAQEEVPARSLWPAAYWWLGWTDEASAAMEDGGPDPKTSGQLAHNRQEGHNRVAPVIVVHGSADPTVAPLNGDQVIGQFAQMNDIADDGDGANDSIDGVADHTAETAAAPGVRAYRLQDYHDTAGRPVMRQIRVEGLGHAWSGGDPAGSYTDQLGPEASRLIWRFFQDHALAGP